MSPFFQPALAADTVIAGALNSELARQNAQIELIASENIVSPPVLTAQGSVLTNKYAEGYPGRRCYGGCEYANVVEAVAIAGAKTLFGAGLSTSSPTPAHRPMAQS